MSGGEWDTGKKKKCTRKQTKRMKWEESDKTDKKGRDQTKKQA